MFLLELEQRSAEWHYQRRSCLVTASDAGAWIYENDERSRKARHARIMKYLTREQAATDPDVIAEETRERIMLDRDPAIRRGIDNEDAAVLAFEKITGLKTEVVGMAVTDDFLYGASADRFILWVDEGLETKVPFPNTQAAYVIENQLKGGMIEEYLHQVHFSLAVTEFDRWHFYSHPLPYQKGNKLVVVPYLYIRVEPGEITKKIRTGMIRMKDEMEKARDIYTRVSREQAQGKETAIHERKL